MVYRGQRREHHPGRHPDGVAAGGSEVGGAGLRAVEPAERVKDVLALPLGVPGVADPRRPHVDIRKRVAVELTGDRGHRGCVVAAALLPVEALRGLADELRGLAVARDLVLRAIYHRGHLGHRLGGGHVLEGGVGGAQGHVDVVGYGLGIG